MIHGIGTDIVQIARMQKSIEQHGEKFARRILTENEFTQYCKLPQPAAFLAKRFAAKEAAAKALGTGFRDGLSLKHIEVSNDERGKPVLSFHEKGLDLIKQFNITETHLSLSDEQNYAVAYVVLAK